MPAPRHRRENPSRPDHQDGQPGDPPIAGSRGDVNGLSLDTFIARHIGTAQLEPGPEGSCYVGRSDWSPWRWQTRSHELRGR
jgi:hypothetical protein